MKMRVRFLWITDPWETLDHPRDTTLRLAQEALLLGHECWWSSMHSLCLTASGRKAQVLLTAQPLRFLGDEPSLGRPLLKAPSAFHSIHWRVDPPVDLSFLHPLQILNWGTEGLKHTEVVNAPLLLFSRGEKTESLRLGRYSPPSLVSSDWDALSAFGRKFETTVIKPLHQCQSQCVHKIDWHTASAAREAKRLLTPMTDRFSRPILIQKFIPAIRKGELRLWFFDGLLLGAMRKMPLKNDFRVNIDRGSRLLPARLNSRETKAARAVAKHLKNQGIRLAAIDMIGGYVTDLNFTSPGLLRQLEEVTGKNLARTILRGLKTSIQSRIK